MNPRKNVLLLAFIAVLLSACAATKEAQVDEDNQTRDENVTYVENPTSLAEILMRVPGIYVDDRYNPPQVTIRGGVPLFVVDGVKVGRSYAAASHAVNVSDIRSVEVLKSPSETVIYGREASNGVILIRTM